MALGGRVRFTFGKPKRQYTYTSRKTAGKEAIVVVQRGLGPRALHAVVYRKGPRGEVRRRETVVVAVEDRQ